MSRHRALPDLGVRHIGVDDVRVTRGSRVVLDGVTVAANAGEVLALTGPSGSGKSTLLALLAGLDTPDTGRVFVDDAVRGRSPRSDFGLVLQGYGLVGVLTAAENVAVPLKAAGLPPRDIADRIDQVLGALGLTEVADHLIEELSGGQQQRVALARALAIRPAVLLADEVTAELDADTQQRALQLVFDCADQGAVVVLATHDPAVAALADHETHLRDGAVTTRR